MDGDHIPQPEFRVSIYSLYKNISYSTTIYNGTGTRYEDVVPPNSAGVLGELEGLEGSFSCGDWGLSSGKAKRCLACSEEEEVSRAHIARCGISGTKSQEDRGCEHIVD